MKCGKGHYHDTVEEVKACYGIGSYQTYKTEDIQDNLPGEDYASRPPRNVTHPGKINWDDIPVGYYATPSLTGNNDLDFWHVEKPESGQWQGWTFVKRVIGGRDDAQIPGDSKKKVKTERIREKVTQLRALEAIREFGPEKSAELFGTELKYCRICGIHLTDEISRSLGIGPVCRAG